MLDADFSADSDNTTDYGQQRGFQGLLHVEEVGLIENRNRMLDPLTGRFLERDPLGYPDGMNAYAAYHVLWGGLDPSGQFLIWKKEKKLGRVKTRMAVRHGTPASEPVSKMYNAGRVYPGTKVTIDTRLLPDNGGGSGMRANHHVDKSRPGQIAKRSALRRQIEGMEFSGRTPAQSNPMTQTAIDGVAGNLPIVGDYYGTGFYNQRYMTEGAEMAEKAGVRSKACMILNAMDLTVKPKDRKNTGVYDVTNDTKYHWRVQRHNGKCYFTAYMTETRFHNNRVELFGKQVPFTWVKGGSAYGYYTHNEDIISLGECVAEFRCYRSDCSR